MPKWFQSETFWAELYPYLFDDQRFAAADEEIRNLLNLTGVRRGAVLDLCCGPGRHSIALARRGFDVTGVDGTPFLLNKARRRARSARVPVEFIRADMRNFVRPNAYKLVLNLWTSFGYFDNKDDDRRVLRNIFASLAANGACVIDVRGKEHIAKVLQPIHSTRYADGAFLIQAHEVFDDWTRIRNEWILLKGNRARRFKFRHTIYSGQELKDLLRQTGFAEVKLYGDFDGQPYGLDAPRLVAVARKG
jgi:SAM-dependent methyltransferase